MENDSVLLCIGSQIKIFTLRLFHECDSTCKLCSKASEFFNHLTLLTLFYWRSLC